MIRYYKILRILFFLQIFCIIISCNQKQISEDAASEIKKKHYVELLQEKLDLTENETKRLRLILKSYKSAQANARNEKEARHLRNLRQQSIRNIIGEEKHEIMLELKRDGEI